MQQKLIEGLYLLSEMRDFCLIPAGRSGIQGGAVATLWGDRLTLKSPPPSFGNYEQRRFFFYAPLSIPFLPGQRTEGTFRKLLAVGRGIPISLPALSKRR